MTTKRAIPAQRGNGLASGSAWVLSRCVPDCPASTAARVRSEKMGAVGGREGRAGSALGVQGSLQLGAENLHILGPPVGIFGQTGEHHLFQLQRNFIGQICAIEGLRLLVIVGLVPAGERIALRLEGVLPGQHAVEHHAKRVDIRAGIQGFPAQLFGRGIAHRTQKAGGLGAEGKGNVAEELGNAEIQDFDGLPQRFIF